MCEVHSECRGSGDRVVSWVKTFSHNLLFQISDVVIPSMVPPSLLIEGEVSLGLTTHTDFSVMILYKFFWIPKWKVIPTFFRLVGWHSNSITTKYIFQPLIRDSLISSYLLLSNYDSLRVLRERSVVLNFRYLFPNPYGDRQMYDKGWVLNITIPNNWPQKFNILLLRIYLKFPCVSHGLRPRKR